MPDPDAEPLTVAIPFYKGHAYLRAAIESVLRQTSPAWRLIVCDDGPEPSTREVVELFGDARIRYLKNDRNLGMAGNWNRCLDAADTDLVNLLHNDDELLPNYVELMLRARREYPDAVAFFCRAKIINSAGRKTFSLVDYVKQFAQPTPSDPVILHGEPALESLMRGNFIMCPTVCYRKSRLGGQRFSRDWHFALDLEFYTHLLLGDETIVGVPDTAYAYRRHGGNATAAYTESLLRFEEESQLHDQVAQKAQVRGWTRAASVAARKRIIKWHLRYRIAADIACLRIASAKKKWGMFNRLK